MRLEFFEDAASEIEEDRGWYRARSELAEAARPHVHADTRRHGCCKLHRSAARACRGSSGHVEKIGQHDQISISERRGAV